MMLPTTPSFRLDGKRALVTGASSGIGLAAAIALCEAGANVTMVARRVEKLAASQEALAEKGFSVEKNVLDISDVKAIESFIADHEPFDVLINSAGMGMPKSALDMEEQDLDAVMEVNVKGAYFLTRSIAGQLIQHNKSGSLINISSQMGHVGGIDRSVYCASKFAVEGFTKAMAIEFGKHQIRVNTICPTFIRTPLTQSTFDNPDRVKWIEEKIKLGRVGEVEDIMGACVFLASDASALITGTALMVDGGWTAE